MRTVGYGLPVGNREVWCAERSLFVNVNHIDDVRGHAIEFPCAKAAAFFNEADTLIEPMCAVIVAIDRQLDALKFPASRFECGTQELFAQTTPTIFG